MTLLRALNKVFSMYITVLDFQEGQVYQYSSPLYVPELDDSEILEDFLTSKGHNLTNCEWMSHTDGEIITEKAEI